MLKRLAGCVRQYKGASLLSPLFVVLEVIMEVIIPLLYFVAVVWHSCRTLCSKGICWVRQEYPA